MSEDLDSLHPTLRKLPGQTIVERYTVAEALGVGGMGAVFRGHHLGLKRDVAIKVLHPDLTRDPEISKRFDREAHSASRLDHPNCLRVTDVGTTEDGVKFMVMDLLSGSELADRLGEEMLPDRAVVMMLQVLRGLEHAHEHGVIHRDIKPENIFITRDHDGHEVLKLVDFGIAKLVGGGSNDTRMTKAGLIFGTPAYMSPEQAMGMEADVRADLYAVGVILYEMLEGTPPFESDDPVKLVRMQVSKDPPPLSEHVNPQLGAVVMKLLAKDRDERYQTATEAREALEMVLPLIATTDIISVAVLGSQASGPIVLNPASGPFPRINNPSSGMHVMATDRSGAFSPSSLPTLPPGGGALRKPRSKLPLIGGAAIVVLGLAAWLASGGDGDDPSGNTSAGVVEPVGNDDDGAKPPEADDDGPLLTIEDGPDEDRLNEIDRLILGSKLDEAQDLLKPLLDDYPDNPILSWRQGRIFAKRSKRSTKYRRMALTSYGDALDAEPTLLDDNDFYAELNALLTDSKLRNEALDFALRKMGQTGHKVLLELVNNEKSPMGYNDRRRALEELSSVDENSPLVNWQLHLALDVLQATESLTPCTAYREALESISGTPDYWYLKRVERAKLPKAKTGEGLTEEEQADAVKCEGLEAIRDEVIAQLEDLAPVEDSDGEELVIEGDDDGAESPEKKPGGSKSGGSKSGAGKSGGSKSGSGKSAGCDTPFGIFKKKCR